MTPDTLDKDLKRIHSINAAAQADKTGKPKGKFEQEGSPTPRVVATDEVSMQTTMANLRRLLPGLFQSPIEKTDTQDDQG